MNAPSSRAIGIACAIGGVVGFSLKAVVAKLIYAHGVDAVTLMALRMGFSLPFFAGIAWWTSRRSGQPPVSQRDAVAIVVLGVVGYYMSSMFDFLGLERVSAAVGRLILYAYPTLTVLLSAVALKKPVTSRDLAALAITYLGVALVMGGALGATTTPGSTAQFLAGALLIFGAAVGTAIYLVFGGETIKRVGSMRFTAYAMSIAVIPALAQYPLLRPMSGLALPAGVYGLAFLLAAGCTVLPIFLTAEGLKRIGANPVSLYGGLGPVITIAFGGWLLGESMQLLQWLGAIAVIVGVALVTIRPGKP